MKSRNNQGPFEPSYVDEGDFSGDISDDLDLVVPVAPELIHRDDRGRIFVNPAELGDLERDMSVAELSRVLGGDPGTVMEQVLTGGLGTTAKAALAARLRSSRIPAAPTSYLNRGGSVSPRLMPDSPAASRIISSVGRKKNQMLNFLSVRNGDIIINPVAAYDSVPAGWFRNNIQTQAGFNVTGDFINSGTVGATPLTCALGSTLQPRLYSALIIELSASQANAVPGGYFSITVDFNAQFDFRGTAAAAVANTINFQLRVVNPLQPCTIVLIPFKVDNNTAFPVLGVMEYHATNPRDVVVTWNSYPATAYQGIVTVPGPKHPALLAMAKFSDQ